MNITVNHEIKQVPDQCSLTQLLSQILPDSEKGIALAINQQIVPRSQWTEHQLQDNDTVTIIRATQGG